MRLSATRIKTYLTCPRQFRYIYVDELPRVPTTPLLFGSAMHETLRWLHECRMENGVLASIEQATADFGQRWNGLLQAQAPVFKPGMTSQDYEAMARQMLAVHLKVSRKAPVPLLLEFPFEVAIGEHTLVGIFDRVDEGETGLVVMDYKTGSRKPSPRDVEADLQLTIYAFGVQQMFGLPVEKVICHWLRDGIDLVSTRDKDDFTWLADEIVPFVANGVESKNFAPKPGYWCRWCDFRELCQAEGTGGGGVPSPTPSN